MQDEEFKNILRKKAESFEIPVRSNAFHAILAKRQNAQKPNNKNVIIFWIAATVTVLGILIYLSSKNLPETIAVKEVLKPASAIFDPVNIKPAESGLIKIKTATKRHEPKNYIAIPHTQNHSPMLLKKEPDQTAKTLNTPAAPLPVLNPNLKDDSVYSENVTAKQKDTMGLIAKKEINHDTIESVTLVSEDTSSAKETQPGFISGSKTVSAHYSGNLTGDAVDLKFSLALYGNYLPYHNISNAANNQEIKNLYPNEFDERAKLVYLTGFWGQLHYKKFTFSTGVAYSEIHFDKIYSAPVLDSVKSGVIHQESIEQNAIDQKFIFLEIPMLVAYKLSDKKINLSIQTGIALQWMLYTQTYIFIKTPNEITYMSQNEIANKRFNKFQYLFVGSIHINYTPYKHLTVFAGPTLRANQKPLYVNEYTVRPAPVSGGLETGIKINF
ncbi:MAG: hypothetical protein Q8M15_01055 [Bacteroidota bacterium]|nr:hypothetical protein [Bacteroidota bacterium]